MSKRKMSVLKDATENKREPENVLITMACGSVGMDRVNTVTTIVVARLDD